MDNKIIEYAERLYSKDSYTPKRLTKETGVDIDIFKHIEKGLNGYVDPKSKEEPENIAKKIEQESSGLVDYQTMLTILVNFMKKAFEIYEHCQKSEYGSKRAFASAFDMYWPYFENFYWRNELSEKRGSTKKLPALKSRIDDLVKRLTA